MEQLYLPLMIWIALVASTLPVLRYPFLRDFVILEQ